MANNRKLVVSVNSYKLDENLFRLGVSYRGLAEMSGTSERAIRKARTDGFISLELAVRMCAALGLTVEELFGRQGIVSNVELVRTVLGGFGGD